MSSKKSTTAPALFWLASLLFFISGGTGLVYQVVWFKRFGHVWGSSSLAFAAVGGSFLFGLGLGAYLFGRVSDRLEVPLRWYGICELLIGTLALIIPFEIAALVDASVGLYAAIPEQHFLRFLFQFGVTLLVIGPPCALMGGTLPLLIRQLTTRDGSLDQATGWLYAINTFGAAAGCYLAGFHFLPSLGLLWTNNLAAAVNITIGLVSLNASVRGLGHNVSRATSPANEQPARADLAMWRLFVATALAGCAALMLEMTWSRQLALVLGGSTYAFSATVFVVLVGIAVGSLIFHLGLRGRPFDVTAAIVTIVLLVVTAAIGKLFLPMLSMALSPVEVRELRSQQLYNGLICVGASAVLELLPAIGMGLLFPLFVNMTKANAARVGAAVGNIYAWNTVGSIAGASFTAILLFPRIGTAGAMAAASGLYVAALVLVIPWSVGRFALRGAIATAVGAAAVMVSARPIDPRLTNVGLYFYGDPAKTYGTDDWFDKITPVFFREGASSNVFVNSAAPGTTSLRVNGKVDASNGVDMVTQLGLAYFPRLLKPEAKNVLVIGFGSGCSSGASLLFPDTHVTCCEIEPAVYEATEAFAEFNHRPQEKTRAWLAARESELPESQRLTPEQIDQQARFQMIFGDGRTAIQAASNKYDLIISEPSNPWLAGVSNLFTKEFFHAAREALTEDGVLAQWIQTYNFTLGDYLMIVRTMQSEFPHYGVVLLADGLDTLLVASNRPLLPSEESLATFQKFVEETPALKADLRKWFGTTNARLLLLEYYQLGEPQLKRLVEQDGSQYLNTDLHLRLEFDAPLHLFSNLKARDTATFGLLNAVDPKWTGQLAAQTGLTAQSGGYHYLIANRLSRRANNQLVTPRKDLPAKLKAVMDELWTAINLDAALPEAYRLMAKTYETAQLVPESSEAHRRYLELVDDDAAVHAEYGLTLMKLKKQAQAAAQFEKALQLQPDIRLIDGSALWANNLAWIRCTSPDANLRNGEEAVRLARKVCELDKYQNPALMDTLAAALAEQGKFAEAIEISEKILSAAPKNEKLVSTVRERIALFRNSQPYREP
ncbi:MAG TPA: fused MFS/spermidine synthase [Pirellulales bacterium]|jgi:spermidine synthase|nr:fused MFS/spermidine synthase [Pirellulales bacterium]